MRILFFIDSMGPGGAERVVSLLADRWAANGHDVTVVTLTEPDADFHRVAGAVERASIGYLGPARSPFHGIWLNLRRIQRIRRLLQQRCPNEVVSFASRMNVLVLASAGRALHPAIVVSERSNPAVHPTPWFVRRLRRRLYPDARAVVAQTAGAAEQISALAPGSRVSVIPNPVTPLAPTADREPGLVVAAGRLERTKGFDVLIRAFASVAASRPGSHLRIYGDGPDRDELTTLIADLDLTDQVELSGKYVDVSLALGRAEVFVLSSRYEGFPNVLLEAMSLGAATVATRCDFGPEEILTDGQDGLLVPVEDSYAMARAICALLDDEERREALARAAVQSVTRFDLDAIGRRWDELWA